MMLKNYIQNIQPDLMKVRVYGTNVISRGIYYNRQQIFSIFHNIMVCF